MTQAQGERRKVRVVRFSGDPGTRLGTGSRPSVVRIGVKVSCRAES
jgi:hypothetical protein